MEWSLGWAALRYAGLRVVGQRRARVGIAGIDWAGLCWDGLGWAGGHPPTKQRRSEPCHEPTALHCTALATLAFTVRLIIRDK